LQTSSEAKPTAQTQTGQAQNTYLGRKQLKVDQEKNKFIKDIAVRFDEKVRV